MADRDFHEEEWIAKYRAAMEAFSHTKEKSWSVRHLMTQFRTYFRRTFPPSVDRLKAVSAAESGNSKAVPSRKNGTFS